MSKSFWKNKKILVTGGTGFLGNHLVVRLKKLEARVTVLDSNTDLREKNNRQGSKKGSEDVRLLSRFSIKNQKMRGK